MYGILKAFRGLLWKYTFLCLVIYMGTVANSAAQKLENICTHITCPDSITISNNPEICPRADQMRAGLLYDINENRIVFHKNLDQSLPIASVTKMMVALITAEHVEQGKIAWTDEVKFTQSIRTSYRSRNYVNKTYRYSLDDLLKSTLIASNNTSASELAKYVGGSVADFVALMNKRALELGMESTSFSNPSGLPERRASDDNVSSPADLLKLTLQFMQNQKLLEVTGLPFADIQINGAPSRVVNTNRLMADYRYELLGLKTGYINRARHCLVSAACIDSSLVVSIVLGVEGAARRNSITQEMINNYLMEKGLCRLGEKDRSPAFVRAVSSGQIELSEEEKNDYKVVYKGARTRYKVRRGDNLSVIASRHSCSVSDLKRWNNLRSTRIYAGQNLYVNTLVKSLEFSPGWMEQETAAISTNKSAAPENLKKNQSENLQVSASKNESIPERKAIKHIVSSGESLSNLALRYSTSVSELMRINNLRDTRIHPGQELLLEASSKPGTADESNITHIVRRGENLSGIAGKYQTTVSSIMSSNNLKSTSIKEGQKLSIAGTAPVQQSVTKTTHVVRRGETLSQLAGKYSCSISQLQSWNNIAGSSIREGQKLIVSQSGLSKDSEPEPMSKEYMIYEVRRGDTLWDIARKFDGTTVTGIKRLNNIRNEKSLKPGMKLKIELAS